MERKFAVILAGGQGTRLRPLSINWPKPIIPFMGQPFAAHQLQMLRNCGVTDVIMCVNYCSELVRAALKDGRDFGIRIHYTVEESALGTAGALKLAEEFLPRENCDVLVLNGDVLTDIDFQQLLNYHQQTGSDCTLALTKVRNPTDFGVVELDDCGRVCSFFEKPGWDEVSSSTISAGIYIFKRNLWNLIPGKTVCSIERDLFKRLITDEYKITGFDSDYYWLDIGTPKKYLKAHLDLLSGKIYPNPFLGDLRSASHRCSFSGSNVKFGRDVKLIDPYYIGDNVVIDDLAEVGPYAVIGADSSVGQSTLIERTVIWNKVKIGSLVELAECVIGTECIIEDSVSISEGIKVLGSKTLIKAYSRV